MNTKRIIIIIGIIIASIGLVSSIFNFISPLLAWMTVSIILLNFKTIMKLLEN